MNRASCTLVQLPWGAVGFDCMHEVMARVLVKHAPERMLWASNWPHPSAPQDGAPDDAELFGFQGSISTAL